MPNPAKKHAWTLIPDKQEEINHKVNKILDNRQSQRTKIKWGIAIGVIAFFGLVLAFTQRAQFSESFLAEVLEDTTLDELFGVEEEVTVPVEELTAVVETAGLEELFAEEEEEEGPVALEELFADTEEVPVELEELFAEPEERIEAVTEPEEITGITPVGEPVSIPEEEEEIPTVAEEVTPTPEVVAEAPEEAAPVIIEEAEGITVVRPEEEEEEITDIFAFPEITELPPEEEITFPEEVAPEVTVPEAVFPTAVTPESPFRPNIHTVDILALRPTAPAIPAVPPTVEGVVYRPAAAPETGPELYLALFFSLFVSTFYWRLKRKKCKA